MVTIDLETRSFADLKAVGAYKYSCDPTTTILCMAYKIDDQPTQIWAPWQGDLPLLRTSMIARDNLHMEEEGLGELIQRILEGEKVLAHNAFFERCHWENILVPLGWPRIRPEQWVCSMAAAQMYGLPGSLGLALKVLGLPEQKGDQRAMRRMMKPRGAWLKNEKGDIWFGTDKDYSDLCEYCRQDVDTEYQLYRAVDPLSPRERKIWLLDQTINWRGVHCDVELANGAWGLFDAKRREAVRHLKEYTGGQVETPNQTAKIIAWAKTQGVEMANCQAGTVAELLNNDGIPKSVRAVLEIRQSVGGAAELKYRAMIDHATDDNIIRGELIYGGAHTGRWTSKGVQLHNAAKNKMSVDEAETRIPEIRLSLADGRVFNRLLAEDLSKVLPTLVRSCIIPAPGKIFVDLDYASIEARVVAWLADEQSLIDAFRRGTPVYEQMAADIFCIPIERVSKAQRALGKVAVLGLGYGMGVDKFYQTCISWGVSIITPELADRAVKLYRNKYPRIVKYWYDLENAIKRVIKTGRPERFKRSCILYDQKQQMLAVSLPNGRWLRYHQCKIVDGSIQYFGRLPPPKSGYGTVYTWGGKTTENQDQALSRDYMALAMVNLENHSEIEVVLTVHDELLLQVPEDRVEILLPEIKKLTIPKPRWANGLPIDIGHWVGPKFKKD